MAPLSWRGIVCGPSTPAVDVGAKHSMTFYVHFAELLLALHLDIAFLPETPLQLKWLRACVQTVLAADYLSRKILRQASLAWKVSRSSAWNSPEGD